jgi:hypothetical protein
MSAGKTSDAIQSHQPRAARAAVAALFLTNGALFSNIVPRYPEIKDGLSNRSSCAQDTAAFRGMRARRRSAAATLSTAIS